MSTGSIMSHDAARAANKKTKRRREEPGDDINIRLAKQLTNARVKRRSVTFILPDEGEGPGDPHETQESEASPMDVTDQKRNHTPTTQSVQALLNLEGGPLRPAMKVRTGVRIGPRRKKKGEHTKQPQRKEWTTTQLLLTDMLNRPGKGPRTQ